MSSRNSIHAREPLKRKRSASIDEGVDNAPPAKQPHLYSDECSLGTTSGSSDCYSPGLPSSYDGVSLGSPPAVFSVLGPQSNGLNAWSGRGDNTPHSQKHPMAWSQFRGMSCPQTDPNSRLTPLPVLSWANSDEVWQAMCQKDEHSVSERDPDMFLAHQGLQPRMRAILLDWLIEVCEVYKLHRETYYLTVDYLDRYLSGPRVVAKGQLQLIGITCLFIASKIEEIYPPKLQEFAYVTDSACVEDEILDEELVVLKALDWNVTPITVVGWLSLFMQLKTNLKSSAKPPISEHQDSFILPQFSGLEYSQTCRLLDLCSMDIGMAAFPYSVIAASAMAHTFSKKHAIEVSGIGWDTLEPCFKWMTPFFNIIAEESTHPMLPLADESSQASGLRHLCPNIVEDESHTLQTHTTTLEMFDKSVIKSEQTRSSSSSERSPAPSVVPSCVAGLLTPPSSSRKTTNDIVSTEFIVK